MSPAPSFLSKDAYFAASVCAIACVSVCVYAHTLGHGFVWDDRAAVVFNADLRPTTPITDIFKHDFWGQPLSSPASHKSYRPLTVLSLRLDYAIGALDATGYHAHNILLHGLVTALVALLAVRTGFTRSVALWSAAVFAVHPVHAEAVCSIVSRADLLSAVWFCLAVISYSYAHPLTRDADDIKSSALLPTWVWHGAAHATAAASMFSKETGVASFLALVGYEWLHAKSSGAVLRSTLPRVSFTVAVTAALLGTRLATHAGVPLRPWTVLENQVVALQYWWQRAFTVAHLHCWYAGLLIWPSNVAFSHGFAEILPVSTPLDIRNVVSGGLYLIIFGAAVFMWRRGQWSALWMCTFAFAAPFLPSSNVFIYIGTEVAERLLYFPSIGFCVCVAFALDGLTAIARSRHFPRLVRLSMLGMQVCMCCVAAWWTVRTSAAWKDEITLFSHALTVSDKNLKSLLNLGGILASSDDANDMNRGMHLLERATTLYPDLPVAWTNVAIIHTKRGQRDEAFAAQWRALDASIRSNMDVYCNLVEGLASQYLQMQRDDPAAVSPPAWALASGGSAHERWLSAFRARNASVAPAQLALIMLQHASDMQCNDVLVQPMRAEALYMVDRVEDAMVASHKLLATVGVEARERVQHSDTGVNVTVELHQILAHDASRAMKASVVDGHISAHVTHHDAGTTTQKPLSAVARVNVNKACAWLAKLHFQHASTSTDPRRKAQHSHAARAYADLSRMFAETAADGAPA